MRAALGVVAVAVVLAAIAWLLRGDVRAELERAATVEPEPTSDAAELDLASTPESERSEAVEISEGRSGAQTFLSPSVLALEDVPASIVGRVRTAHGGEPIELDVRVVDALGKSREVSRDAGEYEARDLEPGHYWVRAIGAGHRPGFGEVELPPSETARLDLVLEKKLQLEVRVLTKEGVPFGADEAGMLGKLHAVASPRALGAWLFELDPAGWSDAERGQFISDLARAGEGVIGRLELAGDLPEFAALCHGQQVLACESMPPGTREITFRLDALGAGQLATLRVHVFDSAGTPVEEASVILSTEKEDTIQAETGASTVYEELNPGRARILVSADTLGGEIRDVILMPGENVVEVRLGLGRRITGRVLGLARGVSFGPSTAFHDVSALTLGRLEPDEFLPRWKETVRFGLTRDATFELPVSAGLYALRIEGPKGGPLVRVDVREASVEGLELESRQKHTLVLRRTRGAWQGVRYEIRDESGLAAASGGFVGPEPLELALARGEHRLIVHEAGGLVLYDAPFTLANEPEILAVGW